jgi:hypothetical protein
VRNGKRSSIGACVGRMAASGRVTEHRGKEIS